MWLTRLYSKYMRSRAGRTGGGGVGVDIFAGIIIYKQNREGVWGDYTHNITPQPPTPADFPTFLRPCVYAIHLSFSYTSYAT